MCLVSVDVLVIRLGSKASLDLVRKRAERVFLLVLAERDDVAGRHLIRLELDEALRIARFMSVLDGNDTLPIQLKPPCHASVVRNTHLRAFEITLQRDGAIETRWKARLPFGSASKVVRFFTEQILPLPAPIVDALPAPSDVVAPRADVEPVLEPTFPEGVPELIAPVADQDSFLIVARKPKLD